MIQADFYPTVVEATYGTLGNPDYEHFAFTDNFLDLDIDTTDIADPYLMGYMGYDKVPRMAQLSKVEYSSDEITFRVVSDQNVNVPWFYMSGCTASYTQSSGVTTRGGYINYNDGNGWSRFAYMGSGNQYARFINDLNIQCINERILSIHITAYFQYNTTSTQWGYSYNWSDTWITFSNSQEFLDFANGDVTKTVTIGGNEIELNGTDFGSGQNAYPGSYVYQGETQSVTIVISITGFRISPNRDVSYGSGSGVSRGYSTIGTGYKIKSTEIGVDYICFFADGYESSFHTNTAYSYAWLSVKRSDLAGGTLTFGDGNDPFCGFLLDGDAYVLGGFDMTIPMDYITEAVSETPLTRGFNLLRAYGSPLIATSTIHIYAIYPISKILEAAQQRTNITKAGTKYYGVTNQSYYPVYHTDNSPAWELANGEPVDVIPELRNWQLGRIYNNDFTWEDIPPYNPNPPVGDEESGDRIPNQYRFFGAATNFITQYALTAAQVAEFGEYLWTSWADTLGEPTDMWKNFKILLTGGDTGSVDVGSTLDFIVSLKLFPFDLLISGIDTFIIQNNIKIGTGAYPIEVSGVAKLLPAIIYIDAGHLDVPKPFGTFQDYENMNVSVYLPYCGTVKLNPADVVGYRLRCRYSVDLQSGNCVAVVEKCTYGQDDNTYYNVAVAPGQIGCMIPISATNSGQLASQRISDALSAINTIGGAFGNTLNTGASTLSSFFRGGGDEFTGGTANAKLLGIAPNAVSKLAGQANNMLSRAAVDCPALSGGVGLASFVEPASAFLQMRYGIYDPPANYNKSVGKLSTHSGILSEYSGFTICENVDVSGFTCHEDERAEIKALLESGVYL